MTDSPQGSLKLQIEDAVKASMRARDKPRTACLRLILAAIKQREVDERIELDDQQVLAVLDKTAKQLRESIAIYQEAGRQDLLEKEQYELTVLQSFLPTALTKTEIKQLIDQAITEQNASSIQQMGKVIGALKPQMQGRADMVEVSALVKARLTA